MKTKKLLIKYGHLKLDELPEAIRKEVESSEEASTYFRRSQEVSDLLQLKKFELPPPEMVGRHVYNVRTRLEATGGVDEPIAESFQGRWKFFGYAVAAVCLLMVGTVALQHSAGTQNIAPEVALEPSLPVVGVEPVSTIANLPPLPSAPVDFFQTAELVSSNQFPVNVGAPSGPQYIGN